MADITIRNLPDEPDFITEWLRATENLRGDEFETPPRSLARVVDLA